MYYKCELLVGGYAYAATDHIKNWDDMTVSFKRNDYDGVVRTFTDKFEFVKGARQLILNEYRKNYLRASASIVVSTRNNSWTWTERFRCALDFSTLSDDGFTLSINAVDDSVAALIKAKKGTQYEYSVNEVKDGKSLYYDRMLIDCFSDWSDMSDVDETTGNRTILFPSGAYQSHSGFPIGVTKSEVGIKNIVELNDVSASFGEVYDVPPFFVANKNIDVNLSINGILTWLGDGGASDGRAPEIHVFKKKGKDVEFLDMRFASLEKLQPRTFDENWEISLREGEGLCLAVYNRVQNPFTIQVTLGFHVSVTFKAKGEPVSIKVINPSLLLNKLLKSMNGGKEGLTGVIVPSGEKRLDNAMILPAESIRQMPGAKVYSSFTKFCNWMSAVFGYVYDINDKVVTFRPRKDYFGDSVVKEIKDYNGYSMKINSSLIYSQVNVGYEKQDYDSVNGKDEFRFTNIYNTGITMSDGKLELISPYRADAYGIEFLAQKIGEDTTDNESDTSVFFVCVNDDGSRYVLDRSVPMEGVISPGTMFNAMYSPTSMVEANKDYLGGFVDELLYASSEGNTEVIINGEAENRDLTMSGGLFCVDEVEVETSDVELPEDMTGVVRLEHQGEVLEGYYKSSDFSYTKTKSAKITLIMKKLPIKE